MTSADWKLHRILLEDISRWEPSIGYPKAAAAAIARIEELEEAVRKLRKTLIRAAATLDDGWELTDLIGAIKLVLEETKCLAE